MKARAKSAHRSQIQRKEIEKKRAVGLRGQRNHLSLLIRSSVFVNPLQIRGLPPEAGAVVDKLAVNLSCRKIYKRHNFLRLGSLVLIAYAPTRGQRAPARHAAE